jgi:hypothetical protein
MRLRNSKLLQNLLEGDLPEVKTDNTVKFDTNSLMLLGGVLVGIAVVIAILVVVVKRS